MAGAAFDRLIRELPKAEVHLHFEGAVPWDVVRQLSEEDLSEVPPWWDRHHRFDSFADFIAAMRLGWKGILTGLERIETCAGALFRGLAAQNVRYVETSFGLGAYDEPVNAVADAIKRGAPEGMTVRVIGGISRDLDPGWMRDLAAEAVEASSVDGIDLHGNEVSDGIGRFADLFHAAQKMGKIAKAHAGESAGPEFVRRTLDILQVKRVEHGISAVSDPELMDLLVSDDVTLDVCPWSNVKLKMASSLANHPLKALCNAGVRTTVSTDDPTVFGQTLSEEIDWVHSEMGLPAEQMVEIVKNGFRVAMMDTSEKAACLTEADDTFERYKATLSE
jgi:adenosine deaminase